MVAAGGIADGRGLAAALMLGAAGVMVGTRFWATPEALGSRQCQAAARPASGDDTLRTRVFDIMRELDWPEGYSGRAIVNDFSRAWHGTRRRSRKLASQASATLLGGGARPAILRVAVVFAGEGLDLIHDIRPAGEIVRAIAEGRREA